MNVRSAKNKGVRLQNWVKEMLRAKYKNELEDDDILSATMGQTGADIILSPAARKLIPFSIECKNQEKYGGIYNIMAQAASQDKGMPLGVLKMNRKDPLVVIDARYFFEELMK